MRKYIRKNLIKILLPVLFAALAISLVLFAANVIGKRNAVPFTEKLVINIGDVRSCKADVVLQYKDTFTCRHGDINSDQELEEHRAELAAYYKPRNEKIVKDLNLTGCAQSTYSWYGPFIEYRYDSGDDFLLSDLSRVKAYDGVYLEKVFVDCCDFSDDAERNGSRNWYPFTDALKDIGVSDKQFTGNGVKIGIVESGVPNNYVNLSGVTYETYGTTLTSHSFHTSSVMAANTGIANDAELYFAALSNNSFVSCCNWFISKGVNVINRSNGGGTGTYNSTSAYADYVVKETKMTFVNSAGNDGTTNLSGYPGTGLNVISVASSDWNKGISDYSSAGMQASETISLANPTLTAPGGSLCYIPNIDGAISGTSFSAPVVTGVVALLMEEFPELKYRPETVMTLLSNTCNPALGQTDIWDRDAGFGIVNYERARNCFNAEFLRNFNAEEGNGYQDEIYSAYVRVSQGDTLTAKAMLLVNSNQTNESTLVKPDYSKLKITVYDEAGRAVCNGKTLSNFTYATYINNLGNAAKFKIGVTLDSEKAAAGTEYCALSFYTDEPAGFVFSDGVTVEYGEATEQSFYYEVLYTAGYDIGAVYVLKPGEKKYEPYTPKTEISASAHGGEYVFYFEYDGGSLSDEYTVYLDLLHVTLLRNGETVYDGTLCGSEEETDGGHYFNVGDTLKIILNDAQWQRCNYGVNQDITITQTDFVDGKCNIVFTTAFGSDVTFKLRSRETLNLVIGGSTFEDGAEISFGKDVALGWFAGLEDGVTITITSDNGFEETVDLSSGLTEYTLPAQDGEKVVYTVTIIDEFGTSATFTVTIDSSGTGSWVVIFIVVVIVIVIAAVVISVIVLRKRRKQENC